MDRYNPHLPRILGQEWVPIREEDLIYNQVNNNIERGYSFSVTGARFLSHAKYYINKFPENFFREEVFTANIYPAGTEDQSGPIRSVIIPCNGGALTGSSFSYVNATGTADALQNPSSNRFINMILSGPANSRASMFFAVNQYAQLLGNKRILGVNLLYSASQQSFATDDRGQVSEADVYIMSPNVGGFTGFWQYPGLFGGNNPLQPLHNFKPNVMNRIFLGDTNLFWNTNTTAGLQSNPNVIPWTYSELQRFEATSPNPYQILIESASGVTPFGPVFALSYMALEIVFCEEKRIIFGSTVYNGGTGSPSFMYLMGGNSISLVDIPTLSFAPTILAGTEYTITLSQGNTGDHPLIFTPAPIGPEPAVNALRQLYSIPTLPGIEVNIPFPPTPDIDGQVFTVNETDIIPQLSLHLNPPPGSGVLTEIHPYGRQSVAQVFGNITATQDIMEDDLFPVANYTWPQVRYYARRFGDTIVPLKLSALVPSITGQSGFQSVYLTPQQWDNLDEIVDGWKEVTLRFPVAPIMTGGTSLTAKWAWSAAGETSGNRWEVLGATAPALSGLPGNMLKMSPVQLGSATYGQPTAGTTVDEEWMPGWSPLVSATTDDPASDAVLIFSQDMPSITGMTISVLNQAVSGIGLNCGLNPAFIPSQIKYNRITWPTQQFFVVNDDFTRTSASGWGTATSGQTWTTTGGVATDYTVNGSSGVVSVTAAGSSRITSITASLLNLDGSAQISMTTTPTVAMTWGALTWHNNSVSNDMYQGEIDFMPDGSVAVAIRRWVAGVDTVLASQTVGYNYVLGTKFNIKVQQRGFFIRAKAWIDGDTEPSFWQLRVSDTNFDDPASVGTRTRIDAGGGTPQVVVYDNVIFTDANFGALELQRMDTVDTTWQTIMKATSPAVSGFNDYEARVGLLSSYRIRGVNALNFAGPWSSTVTSTVTAPGVVGTQIDTTSNVLIFTTNEVQNGSSNLAYCNAWDGEVVEDFTFPEANFVKLQAMYNKDFFTAFRPRERGGAQFTRSILVQAAAIAPPTLADFNNLRDMAWDDVSYICVRDDDGNRWLAAVMVPSGAVRHFRGLYIAQVNIAEVTATPSPVDPS